MKTFRDSDGLWENHNVADAASPEGWRKDSALVLEFYNQRRRQPHEVEPNDAHKLIADLEKYFEVQIVPQNIDDLHERACSTNILHIHGELFKSCSCNDKSLVYEQKTDIKIGHKYEGHYAHFETKTKTGFKNLIFRKGNFLVSTEQDGVKYLLETLEPEATDSFFNWHFFDAILGQKEYFSDYVFEDTAAELLKNDQVLRTAFEFEKIANPDFTKDGNSQLDWIYRHSDYYEKKGGTVSYL